MTERSAEGSKYKNGHISDITYMVRGWELFRWIDTCLAHLMKNWYDKAEYKGK